MRLHHYVTDSLLLAVVKIISLSLFFIFLTSCVHTTDNHQPDYRKKLKDREEVFNEIARQILKSKKRRVVIIDFTDKDGKKIEGEDKDVAEEMAVSLNKIIGEQVWIESGESLMNALEKHGIIKNGKIDSELAREFWQTRGIEVVITGYLEPHRNETKYFITLLGVKDNKLIHRPFIDSWKKKNTVNTKGGPSPEPISSSHGVCRVPPFYAKEDISNFLNSHNPAPVTLADVAKILESALKKAEFENTAYSLLPEAEGFVLVSSAKEFKLFPDGVPMWSNNRGKNLQHFFSDLSIEYFSGRKANIHQVVCVIVTSGAISNNNPVMTFKEAKKLSLNREITVPNDLYEIDYNKKRHKCKVLLYAYDDKKNPLGDTISIRKLLHKTQFWD